MKTNREIEFWFDFSSNYSYLSLMRIQALTEPLGIAVNWKPFLLGPLFKDFGWNTSPFILQPEKGRYVWQDMVRQCAKYGLPWQQPTEFPRRSLLPMRVALLGASEPWGPDFCKQIMVLNFARDHAIDDAEIIWQLLTQLGLDADALLAEAQSEANKQRLREQTEQARGKGVFGAPTFFVGTEMFWGNDRLEDAIEAAMRGGDVPV